MVVSGQRAGGAERHGICNGTHRYHRRRHHRADTGACAAPTGISSRVYEAAPKWKRLGVGINLLPHGVRELSELGLQKALGSRAVETREMSYYSRHGEFIYSEPRGRFAGYDWPQFSIHRGDFHEVLADAVRERVGEDAVVLNHKCIGVDQDEDGVTIRFVDSVSGASIDSVRGVAVAACDGIHSAVRRQMFPNEGPPSYKGINMWRGVTRWKPFSVGRNHGSGRLAGYR